MNITLIREKLSDGSYVFNLRIGATDLHAYSQDDAMSLYEIIAEAVERHTTDAVKIMVPLEIA